MQVRSRHLWSAAGEEEVHLVERARSLEVTLWNSGWHGWSVPCGGSIMEFGGVSVFLFETGVWCCSVVCLSLLFRIPDKHIVFPFLVEWVVRTYVRMYGIYLCTYGTYVRTYVRMVRTYVSMVRTYVRMVHTYVSTFGMYVRTYVWYVRTYGTYVRMVVRTYGTYIRTHGTYVRTLARSYVRLYVWCIRTFVPYTYVRMVRT